MLGLKSVEGLNIQQRIKDVVALGHKNTQVYDSKIVDESAKKPILFNRNISSYNPEQQELVTTELRDFMQTFDYCSQGEPTYEIDDGWLQEQ